MACKIDIILLLVLYKILSTRDINNSKVIEMGAKQLLFMETRNMHQTIESLTLNFSKKKMDPQSSKNYRHFSNPDTKIKEDAIL